MLWGEYNYDEDIAAQRQEAFDDGARQKAIETARNLLVKNIPIDVIAECTGLSQETIEQLVEEN